MLDALKAMGHKLVVRPGALAAAPCVIQLFPVQIDKVKTVRSYAAGDPHAGRHAMAIE
jgi:hypothetical protein